MKRRSCVFAFITIVSTLLVSHVRPSSAGDDTTSSGDTSATVTSSAPVASAPAAKPMGASGNMDEVVISGIRRGDLILPTTVTSSSSYGLDLGVMDTPRNNTVLSKAQLDALDIQNPAGFSYLTSSSYSDASFGEPNVPRIRGQYADIFYNGMRDSFTDNGYGAPVSFDSADSIDIVKGPASVQGGPGAGVGGSINIATKMPDFTRPFANFDLDFDTQEKRRAGFDAGTPLSPDMALRVSFADDDSGSYYDGMFFHQQSLYSALQVNATPQYSILITGSFENTTYRENDGVNRVNQALIDSGTYLTGGPTTAVSGYLTPVLLNGTTNLSDQTIIDETPGTSAHAQRIKGQVIQTFAPADDFSIVNNTFYEYLNRYNQTMYYYADTSMGDYSVENKTDLKAGFSTWGVQSAIDGGFTYRYVHVDTIQNFLNEPVSVWDLSTNPDDWVFPPSAQASGGAQLYQAAFGQTQWGVPGRNPEALNGSIISNLQDAAIFFEHRLQFSPQWSAMYGLRGDLVQLDEADPLGGPGVYDGLPDKESTGWYGLYNGNVSLIWTPSTELTTYLTVNKAQYVLPDSNDGAVGTFGEDPTVQLRQNTGLEEAGMKFNLLDQRLFVSSALFHQTRSIPSGPADLDHSEAHITGAEVELNYQPDPRFFATASYSYLHSQLDTAESFYNFPAYAGLNYDGAGSLAVFTPGQKFLQPGVPEHLFNVLVNYKHWTGLGVQANLQVTGPMYTTQSGTIDVAATNALAESNGLPQLVGVGGVIPLSIVGGDGAYSAPRLPWQYTLNTSLFYTYQRYTFKLTVYNVTGQRNLTNDYPYYGNDFLTRVPPRSFDLMISGKL